MWLKECIRNVKYFECTNIKSTFLLRFSSHMSATNFDHVQMVGLSKGALDSAVAYIHEREAFSQKIADFQVSLPASILVIAISIACGIIIFMYENPSVSVCYQTLSGAKESSPPGTGIVSLEEESFSSTKRPWEEG